MNSHRRSVGVGEDFGHEASLENCQSFGGDIHQSWGGGFGPAVKALPQALASVQLLGDWVGHTRGTSARQGKTVNTRV